MRWFALVLATLLAASDARALEPWSDADPAAPPERYEIGAIGVRAEAEYRAQYIFVDPLSLTTLDQNKYMVLEHRARLGATIDYQELVSLTSSFDVLDSVLWGDNGSFGGDPSSDSGVKAVYNNPTIAKACILPLPGKDALTANGYGWGLCDSKPIYVRRLYAQVKTPIGALRVGRQAAGVGAGIVVNDGDGRRNRFGVAYRGNNVDRVLFGTKPLEALKPKAARDLDENHGLVVAGMYDRLSSDDPVVLGNDVNQAALAVVYHNPDFRIGRDLELIAYYLHRWNSEYSTYINSVGLRAGAKFEKLDAGFEVASNLGKTSEVAAAYSLITNDPAVPQTVAQLGARAVLRWDERLWTAYLEGDFASGDSDPRVGRPLTQFVFAEDTNVGLLMFKHVLWFQSARASAAGVLLTKRLGAQTFPAERIDTRGAFTDAAAIFPQLDVRPHPSVLLRGGVLAAWAPARLIDPVQTLAHLHNGNLDHDAVNFVGGKPGNFYGVELDGRVQWRFMDHFALDLEGAVLFPGDALQDVNGYAQKSMLVQGRTTFFF